MNLKVWLFSNSQNTFFDHKGPKVKYNLHYRWCYNSLSESIRNNSQSLETAFKQHFTEDRYTLDLTVLQ